MILTFTVMSRSIFSRYYELFSYSLYFHIHCSKTFLLTTGLTMGKNSEEPFMEKILKYFFLNLL